MKTWVCTTLTSFLAPMQGPARLYAYIKKQGHDVSLHDLNQDAYFTLLSRPYLEQCLERVKFAIESIKRNKFLREDIGSILLNSSNNAIKQLLVQGILRDSPWHRPLNSSALKKPVFGIISSKIEPSNVFYALLAEKEFVISEVDRARETLDKNFFALAPDEFLAHFRSLLCGKAIRDAAYFPAQLDFGLGFQGTAYAPRLGDITRAVQDERHNFLIPYYRQEVMPLLSEEHPDIVGISVTHTSEFIPAFTLAHLIKSEHPEIHICLGGSTVTEVSHRIRQNSPLWDYFDSLILGPGEHAFSQLIEHVEKGGGLSGVPNLIYKENGSIRKSDKLYELDINDACTPEYVSVRPKCALPLETSSGCYWGRCIFCYYPKQGTADFDPEYQKRRVRNIELVLDDIRKLRDRYEPVYIGITDSSLHPKRIEQIAEQNLNSEKKVNFTAFIRFEKEFKSPAFCHKLAEGGFLGGQVGLESGSQRVNDIINKGVDLEDAAIAIQNLHRAGILIHLYTVIGLPEETKEDALMTYNFIRRWHRRLALGWQIYSIGILEHGPLAARAAEFGLSTTPLPDEFLIQVMQYQMKEGLSQEESTALSIRFYEKLKQFLHPLNKVMDIESHKVLLLVQKAKGITHDKMKKV